MADSFSNPQPWLVLILFLAICLGVGGLGSFFTASSVRDWYPRLRKPTGTPPSWVFGPVWTALYVLMAISAWLVWREYHRGRASGAAHLLRTTGAECRLVGNFLRLAHAGHCLGRDRAALVRHRFHYSDLLRVAADRGVASDSLLAVGHIRGIPELGDLATQPGVSSGRAGLQSRVTAPRLGIFSSRTQGLRTGLTALPPLRGWSIGFPSGFIPLRTQSRGSSNS